VMFVNERISLRNFGLFRGNEHSSALMIQLLPVFISYLMIRNGSISKYLIYQAAFSYDVHSSHQFRVAL